MIGAKDSGKYDMYPWIQGFPDGSVVKNLPDNAGGTGDLDSIHGLGRFPGGGNGNLLQYSCLGNPVLKVQNHSITAEIPSGTFYIHTVSLPPQYCP